MRFGSVVDDLGGQNEFHLLPPKSVVMTGSLLHLS